MTRTAPANLEALTKVRKITKLTCALPSDSQIAEVMQPSIYRSERKSKQLTQNELAKILGVPRESISRREKGKQRITREAAIAMSVLPGKGVVK